MTTHPVCDACGYNLPHHDRHCAHAAPLRWLCVEHAPRRPSSTDDATTKRPCAVCAAPTSKGYEVEPEATQVERNKGGRPVEQPCGTVSAYKRHQRRKEPIDQACRDAWAAKQRELYAARKQRSEANA